MVNLEVCNGCGLCVTSCGRSVFRYDYDARQSVVTEPVQCMVGCTTCANICTEQAISFQPFSDIRLLIKRNKVIQRESRGSSSLTASDSACPSRPRRPGGLPTLRDPTVPALIYTVDVGRADAGVSVAWTRGAEIRLDTGVDLADNLFGPADLLGAAFAACLLKNVEWFSHILPFRCQGASVRVTLEREQRPPRIAQIRYEIRLVTDEPEQRVRLVERNLVQFGTIYNTLSHACDVSGQVVVETSPHGDPS